MSRVEARFNEVAAFVETMDASNVSRAEAKRAELAEAEREYNSLLGQLENEHEMMSEERQNLGAAIEELERGRSSTSWWRLIKRCRLKKGIEAQQSKIDNQEEKLAVQSGRISTQVDETSGLGALQLQIAANIERVGPPTARQLGKRPADWEQSIERLEEKAVALADEFAGNPEPPANLEVRIRTLRTDAAALKETLLAEIHGDRIALETMSSGVDAFEQYADEPSEKRMLQDTRSVLADLGNEVTAQTEILARTESLDDAMEVLNTHLHIAKELGPDNASREMGRTSDAWRQDLASLDRDAGAIASDVLDSLEITPKTRSRLESLLQGAYALAYKVQTESRRDAGVVREFNRQVSSARGGPLVQRLKQAAQKTLDLLRQEVKDQESLAVDANAIEPLNEVLQLRVDLAHVSLGKSSSSWRDEIATTSSNLRDALQAVLEGRGSEAETRAAMTAATTLAAAYGNEVATDGSTVRNLEKRLQQLDSASNSHVEQALGSVRDALSVLQTERDAQAALLGSMNLLVDHASQGGSLLEALKLRADIQKTTLGTSLPSWDERASASARALREAMRLLENHPSKEDVHKARSAMTIAGGLVHQLMSENESDSGTVGHFERRLDRLTPPANADIDTVLKPVRRVLSEFQTERDGQRRLLRSVDSDLQETVGIELQATDARYAAAGQRAKDLRAANVPFQVLDNAIKRFRTLATEYSAHRSDRLQAEAAKADARAHLTAAEGRANVLAGKLRELNSEVDRARSDARHADSEANRRDAEESSISTEIRRADSKYDEIHEALQSARKLASAAQTELDAAEKQKQSAVRAKTDAERERPNLQRQIKNLTRKLSDLDGERTDAQARVKSSVAAMAANKDREHVVERGEYLGKIASMYDGVSVDDIVTANSISNPDLIRTGQKLVIPGDEIAYARAKGEMVKAKAALKRSAQGIESTQKQLDSAESELSKAEENINQAEDRVRAADKRSGDAESKLRSARPKVERLEREAETSERKLRELQRKGKIVVAAAESARKVRDKAQQHVDVLERQVRDTQRESESARSDINQWTRASTQAGRDLSEAQRDIERALGDVGRGVDDTNTALRGFNDAPSVDGDLELRDVPRFRYMSSGQITRNFERQLREDSLEGFEDFASAMNSATSARDDLMAAQIRSSEEERRRRERQRHAELIGSLK